MLTQEDVFLIGMYQEQEETIPDDLLNRLREFVEELNKKLVYPIYKVNIDLSVPLSVQVEVCVVDDNDCFDESHYVSIERFVEGDVDIPKHVNNQVLLAYTLIPFFGFILSWIGWYIRCHEWPVVAAASILYVGGLILGLIDYEKKKFVKFEFGRNIIFLAGGAILTLVLFIFKSNGFVVK